MNHALRDRFAGALLGLAVGDALGAPAEHLTAEQIRRKYGRISGMVGGGWLNLAPGQTTDETEQAILTAESLTDTGAFDKVDLTLRLVSWYASDPLDIGNTTEAALAKFASGRWHPGDDAADTGFSGTNGALVRAVPIALAFHRLRQQLGGYARAAARITHNNPNAEWAAALIAFWVANALDGEPAYLSRGLEQLPGKGAWVEMGQRPKATAQAIDTVHCVYWALSDSNDFEEAVTKVVHLGGDTDTVAALTGAVAGARFGASAIPAPWKSTVFYRDRLIQLAEDLLRLAGPAADPA